VGRLGGLRAGRGEGAEAAPGGAAPARRRLPAAGPEGLRGHGLQPELVARPQRHAHPLRQGAQRRLPGATGRIPA
jgi:hypothetical protein